MAARLTDKNQTDRSPGAAPGDLFFRCRSCGFVGPPGGPDVAWVTDAILLCRRCGRFGTVLSLSKTRPACGEVVTGDSTGRASPLASSDERRAE